MMSKKVLVTISNYDYIEYSKSLFASAKIDGKWDGDFVLIIPKSDKGKFDEKEFIDNGIQIYYGDLLDGNPSTHFYKIYLFEKYFTQWDWIFYTDLDVLFFNNIELNLDIRDKSNLYANLDVLTFDEQFTLGVGKSGYKEEQLKIIKDEYSDGIETQSLQSCFILFNNKLIKDGYFTKMYDCYLKYYNEYYEEGKTRIHDQAIFNLVFYSKWKLLGDKFLNVLPDLWTEEHGWQINKFANDYYDKNDYSNIVAVHFTNFFQPWKENNLKFYPKWMERKDNFYELSLINNFGGWSMEKSCFDYIRQLLPEGKTILEFGSGYVTGELSKYYTMYSVENYEEWVDRYDSTYIYAPIKFYDETFITPSIPENLGWYNPDIVKVNLPKKYDLILVDGPNGERYGRGGFYKYLKWFNTDVPIVFDDVNREPERILMEKVSKKIGRDYVILEDDMFGVII